jgi:CheY-like chemotaxis protein
MSNRLALIIEDMPPIADAFAFILQRAGFQTEIVADGRAALARLDDPGKSPPGVVVLDLNLPQLDGQSVLQHIRATQRLAGAQVIVATANPRMAQEVEDQADVVLLKPVTIEQLSTLAARLAEEEPPD